MATTGLSPPNARPQAKVTACCSAIPTSKNLPGCAAAKQESPVPSGMAAVMATSELSDRAMSVSTPPKTEVKLRPGVAPEAPLMP